MTHTKLFLAALAVAFSCCLGAAEQKPLEKQKWGHVCRGSMPSDWYSTEQAREIADIVVSIQKDNGGWMKNDQMHKLSEKQLRELRASRGDHSCLDNYATTQEMRFLARVWQAQPDERYRESFLKALEMILRCQKGCGGWSQYWPLSGKGSYQDYITFNDDLMTNVLRLLRDIYENEGIFHDITDAATRERCKKAFDKGIECILRCQIYDSTMGQKAIWSAQHDTVAPYYATEGRPHELPSYSGSESATLLEFLMSIEHPSKELQECIHSAVSWLDQHKMSDKAVEDYVNAHGEEDRHVVEQPGNALWGRFIQIGGKAAKPTYQLFFKHLEQRNKRRTVFYKGILYPYTEVGNARESYDPAHANQPIYGIYKDTLQNLYYRFLYNYDDTDPIMDKQGVPQRTSLMPVNRVKYQYLGSWPWEVIYGLYLPWRQLNTVQKGEKGSWLEAGKDLQLSNAKGRENAAGRLGTIKMSATDYQVLLPEGKRAKKVYIFGYANNEEDMTLNGEYRFAARQYNPQYTEYTIDLSEPVCGTLPIHIEGKGQVCLVIRVLCE